MAPHSLVVRREQLPLLQAAVDDALVPEVATHLRTHHRAAVAAISSADLPARVRESIARARARGVEGTRWLVAFAALAFETTDDFDDHPIVRRYLDDLTHAPDDRVRLLLHHMSDLQWAEVMRDARARGR